jgi:hypothetical protein
MPQTNLLDCAAWRAFRLFLVALDDGEPIAPIDNYAANLLHGKSTNEISQDCFLVPYKRLICKLHRRPFAPSAAQEF